MVLEARRTGARIAGSILQYGWSFSRSLPPPTGKSDRPHSVVVSPLWSVPDLVGARDAVPTQDEFLLPAGHPEKSSKPQPEAQPLHWCRNLAQPDHRHAPLAQADKAVEREAVLPSPGGLVGFSADPKVDIPVMLERPVKALLHQEISRRIASPCRVLGADQPLDAAVVDGVDLEGDRRFTDAQDEKGERVAIARVGRHRAEKVAIVGLRQPVVAKAAVRDPSLLVAQDRIDRCWIDARLFASEGDLADFRQTTTLATQVALVGRW